MISSIHMFGQFQPIPLSGNNSWRFLPAGVDRLGIGNFPNGTTLLATLQVSGFTTTNPTANVFRTDGISTQSNVWSMYTGPTAATTSEKGAIFTGGAANSSPNDFCFRTSTSTGDMVMYTNNFMERLRIKGGWGYDAGFVGINRRYPLTMLHIDGQAPSTNPNSTFAAGWRPWMRVGVFMQWESDALYVGVKDEGANRKDAVIAWFDDGPAVGSDYLRFVYTNNINTSPAQGGGPDGIEVGRWSPINGYLGIGNYYNSIISQNPARRLEILRDPNVASNTPSFRITHVQQNPAATASTGLFTDMYTSSTGDFIILATDNTQVNTPLAIAKERFVGINTNTPGNTLEINSQSPAANVPANGNSGLRFTDMRYGVSVPSTPLTNQGVLSVDAQGNVVYVTAPTGGTFGSCVAPTTLTQQTAIDMNGFSFNFLGNQLGSKVTIGSVCPLPITAPSAKLIVGQHSGSGIGTMGIYVVNSDRATISPVYGVYARILPTSGSFLDVGYIAGYFYTSGAKKNIAVYGFADGLSANGTANFGGIFLAANGGSNVGIYAQAPASQNGLDWAGQFEGDVTINGDIEGTGNFLYTSDQRYKTNIDTISNALRTVQILQPRTFFFDTLNADGMVFSSNRQYGLVAQDVEVVLPELVVESTRPAIYDTAGQVVFPAVTYKSLNYNAFIAILMKGMQEQQLQIDSLQTQISNCCISNARTQNPNSNVTEVTLNNSENIVLNQNVPNPFAEQTIITYYLPESVVKAQLLFYDAAGKLIKSVDLNGRGEGQVNVFADDLSNGIYSYALVADGQIADSKKMIKSK